MKQIPSRADALRLAYATIAHAAAVDPTVTGATIILPDGEMKYIDAADARAMVDTAARGGQA